jgi:hypothetical protein
LEDKKRYGLFLASLKEGVFFCLSRPHHADGGVSGFFQAVFIKLCGQGKACFADAAGTLKEKGGTI